MKKYATGPIKKATIQNIKYNEGKLSYEQIDTVVEDNVLFYYNVFNKLIQLDTKFPVTYEEDIHDLILFDLSVKEPNIPNKLTYIYVNPIDLKPAYIDNNDKLDKVKTNTKSLIKKISHRRTN